MRPDRRKQGVGAALVRACEDQAAAWGFDSLGLHHDREDQKLLRFYGKAGYDSDSVPDLSHEGFMLKYVSKPIATR